MPAITVNKAVDKKICNNWKREAEEEEEKHSGRCPQKPIKSI
jgi:hypothetical protein